jgi:hypothetical protein
MKPSTPDAWNASLDTAGYSWRKSQHGSSDEPPHATASSAFFGQAQ